MLMGKFHEFIHSTQAKFLSLVYDRERSLQRWHQWQSHQSFQAQFPFELISDTDEKLCKIFDVIKKKNMYGRKVMGIERSTFIIDPKGVLRKEYRKVKVDGHVEQVLQDLKALRQQ